MGQGVARHLRFRPRAVPPPPASSGVNPLPFCPLPPLGRGYFCRRPVLYPISPKPGGIFHPRVCWKQSLWKGADAHVPPSACPPAAGAAGGRPGCLALAAGFCLAGTPVPVQNTAYAFACPRSVSVQTQGGPQHLLGRRNPGGGHRLLPRPPWETLTQGLWTVPLPTGTLAASDPSLFRLPAGVQRPGPAGDLAGGRGPDPHPLLLPPPGRAMTCGWTPAARPRRT